MMCLILEPKCANFTEKPWTISAWVILSILSHFKLNTSFYRVCNELPGN